MPPCAVGSSSRGGGVGPRPVDGARTFPSRYRPGDATGGGAPGDRTTEAAAGRIWLMQNGVKYANIKALEKGRDTLNSTKLYAAEMRDRKIKNVIIVTDPFHCLRSMTMANDRGLVATCSPVQSGPNALEKSGFKYLIREAGAYLAYITLGRRGVQISDHLPSDNILNKVKP